METYLDRVAKKVNAYKAELTNAVTTAPLISGTETEQESNTTDSTTPEAKPITAEKNQGEQLSQSDNIFTTQTDDKTRVISSNVQTVAPSEQDIADIVGAFSSFSDSTIREIIKLLSYSLLSGEFLSIKDIDKTLSDLIQQIKELITVVEDSEAISKVWLSFSNSIIYCLEEYQKFVNYITANFTKNRSDDYFIIEDNSIDEIPTLSDELQNVIRMFTLTLKVSRKDLLINSDRSELHTLTLLKKQVDKLKGVQKSVAHALDVKLEFLILKWGQRYKCENKNQTSLIKYRIGDTENSIGSFEREVSKLKDWENKIYYHYDFCKDKREYGRYILDTLNKKRKGYDKLNFTELHGLIKYYKDISKSLPELKKIVEYLLEKDYSDDKHDYDQYCIEIFRNYAINNYFSLVSEDETIDLKKYQSIYRECKTKLNNHLSENYFLQKKYLEYVLKRIDAEYAKSSKDDKITVHEKYVKKVNKECSDILDEYYKKKEWAKTHDNYIVILPYEESLVKVSNEEHPDLPNILFFTSFVLPYYKDSIDYEYSKTRQRFREVKALTNVVGSLKADLQKLEGLNKDFDRKDLKSIETISLFTAVITFVLSSIPAFKFVDTLEQAMLFMLTMSASLGIFILLIFSFTRGVSKVLKKPQPWLSILIVILIFGVIFSILKATSMTLIEYEKKEIKDSTKNDIKDKPVNGLAKKPIQNKNKTN